MISSVTNFQQLQLDCMLLILKTCECTYVCVCAPFSSLCNQVRAQQFYLSNFPCRKYH